MLECPRCNKHFDTGHALSIHWGGSHGGPLPDDIDTSVSIRQHKNTGSNWEDYRRRVLERHGLLQE